MAPRLPMYFSFIVQLRAASKAPSSIHQFKEIEDVTVLENGTCWVSGRDGCIERFYVHWKFLSIRFLSQIAFEISWIALKLSKPRESLTFDIYPEKVLSIFALNRYEEPESLASLELDIAAKELVYDPNTKSLLIFAHGNRDVIVVSLAKMKAHV